MSIIRVEKTGNYTVMSNHHLRDKNLSLKAKGLLSYMLSCCDDWDFSIAGLQSVLKEGKDAIRAALKELEREGYLVRVRNKSEVGITNKYDYIVYEEPQTGTNEEGTNEPDGVQKAENPTSENPNSANPKSDYQTERNNNKKRKTKNKEILISNNPSEAEKQSLSIDVIKEVIKKNIAYNEYDKNPNLDLVDNLVGIMTEMYILALNGNNLRFEKETYPAELVLNKIDRINWMHIEYILECLRQRKDPHPIGNIKAYLQKTLLNAPDTINAWYRAAVQHDMQRGYL